MAKRNTKKKQPKKPVQIRKVRTGVNYRVTYDYDAKLTSYIKENLPREHWKVHKESFYDPNTKSTKDIWSRDIRKFSIGKVISFLVDNAINFEFVGMTSEEIDELRNEFRERQTKLRKILQEKTEGLDVSDMNFDKMLITPYDYQKKAVKFFEINDGNAILADQPGVGKTCSAFSYAARHNLKTLIICPSSLKLNWKREIKDFLDQDSFVYKYNPPRRSKKVNYPKEDCNFHIINYESLDTYFKYEFSHKCGTPGCDFGEISLEKSYKKCPLCSTPKSVKSRRKNLLEFEDKTGMSLNPEDYDLVILDECHYIKNEMAQRTKTIKKAFKDVPRKILISGTPIKSRPIEFFSILNFLRPEEFNSSHEFGKRYGAGFQDNYGWKYDGASNLEELFERVQPYFLRRLKSDVLELPPKTFVEIPIELSSKQISEYTKVEEGVVEQLNGEDNSGEKKSALEIILELKRYVSAIKVKESLPIIRDMVEQGEKIVVFSEFQDSAEAIKEAFGNQAVMIHGRVSTEDRDNAVQSFQDPNSDVMVFSGTIGAAGVGLTLTRSSNLLFIGSAWTPSDMEQAQDRVHRASTTANKVTIMTLYCEDTIDEYIMELLSEKSAVVDKAIDNKVNKKKIEKTDSLSQEVSNGSIVGALIAKLTEGNF